MQSLLANLDFFVTVPPIQSLETLAFLQFPVAQVSPPPPPITVFSDLLFLCISSVSDVSLQIDKFQVETALSKFIADVFPQDIGFSVEDFKEDEDLLSEKIKGQRHTAGGKVTQRPEVMQFETPELDVFAENGSFFKNEGIQNLSKATEVEENLDMINPGLAIHCYYELQESFLLVQDIAFEYPMEEKSDSADNCSLKDQIQFNQLSFPILEVDETVLNSITGFSAEEKIISCFQAMEPHDPAKDCPDTEDIELWGGKECDISRLLSDQFLSGNSFGSDLDSKDNFPEVDLISLVEIPQIRMKSEAQGTLDVDFYLSAEPVVFQEYYILDVDSVQAFEAFLNRQSSYEPGTCGGMFNEEVNFMDFYKLIVCHELNLVDDTFKSFPVPVICDRENLRSFEAIIKEKLANLKPHPLSALDEIYLDWHLLEEDKHNDYAYHCQNILRDMTVHRIDYDWDSLGERNAIYRYVLLDDSVNAEQYLEPKEFLSVSSGIGITAEVESSAEFSEPDDGVQFVKKNSERGSLLFKPMSKSDDLDFFLNAQKATTRTNGESELREVNTKARSSKDPSGSSVASIPRGEESVPVLDKDENIDLQEIFDDFSMAEIYDMRTKKVLGEGESQSEPLPIPSMPFAKEAEYPHGNQVSLPEAVVLIANTQNLDKEMIVSRRSTYQRILAIEKEGAQVVERDSELPVDIILNASTCLVWYNCRNIGRKATALDEASSSLPLCIENIATNVLTLLSFSFSGCIMVFEGEDNFLSTVMEFSDELYAAAASLGMDVQLFFSYSSDSTDEIIMNCIRNETRGLYPRMSESETLAESFLTKFPSVNPLTAHAILSSGGILIEFLEWSNERRIHAIQKYHVPHESIALLGALCKYGEREDSRSIMTDCSSVSSGTDSKSFNLNVASKRKRWTCDDTLSMSGTHMDDSFHFELAKQISKDTAGPSSVQKPYDSFVSKDPQSFRKFRNPRLYDRQLFHEELDLDVNLMMDPSDVPRPHDFHTCSEPQMFKKIRAPEFSFDNMLSGQVQGDVRNEKRSRALFEDQKGEVIDLTRSPRSGKKGFSSIDESISFLMPDFDNDAGAQSKAARGLSFGKDHLTRFPASDGMFSEKRMWESVKDQRRSFEASSNSYSGIDFGGNASLIKHPNKLLEECFKQRSAENSHGFEFQDNESSQFEGTLKNALSFSSPGKKSPWTMEFLNKVRDKSRLRHQSLPCDASAASGFSGNISKDFKRRSPSILEFFKYQGGSTKRVPEQKKQRRSGQALGSSKVEKRSASASSIQPTWTPADKRARQILSFTTNSGERQTKLVWNDGACNRSNKFRNQI